MTAAAILNATTATPEAPATIDAPGADEPTIRAMATALVAHGHLTQDEADQRMKAELSAGLADAVVAQQSEPAPAAPLFPDYQPLPGFEPPADPGAFDVSALREVGSFEQLREAQHLLRDARLTPGIGKMLVDTVAALDAKPISDLDWQRMHQQTLADIETWWPGRADVTVEHARRFVQQLGKRYPILIDALDATGAGSHPAVVRLLAEHGERIFSGGR